MLSYKEQLLHPNWQRKRLEVMQRDGFACCMCRDTGSTLHVHHKEYFKGRMAWEYPADELVTLCAECHVTAQEMKDQAKAVLAKLPVDGPGDLWSVLCVVAGYANGQQGLDFSALFHEEPHAYAAGEAAFQLEDKLHLDHLFALVEALRKTPRWVVHKQLKAFIAAMAEHVDDPAPASYLELGLDDRV